MKIRHLPYFIMLNFINQRAYFQRISYNFNEVLMKRQSLNKNWEYAEAVVMDHFFRIRYTHYFSYKFSVGENEYQGEGRYFSENDTISAGDTIIVIYDRTDPNNSATLRDYLGRSF